jgi:hypothetical protein
LFLSAGLACGVTVMNSDKIREVREKYTNELLRKTNVVGVGIGYKKKEGEKTEIPSLVVMVRKKVPLTELDPRDVVPAEIEGVVTDVREVGEIKAL